MDANEAMGNSTLSATSPSKTDSDRELLQHFLEGQEGAATVLYERYAKRLHAMARVNESAELRQRVDADDIVQSVFRSFFRRASLGCYQIPAGDDLWKLLFVITLQKVRSAGTYHRAAKRDIRVTSHGDWLLESARKQNSLDEWALIEMRMLVGEVVEKLPASHQRMIQLRMEGHEVSEIAIRTERSKRSVERVLHDFRRVLRDKLEEKQDL